MSSSEFSNGGSSIQLEVYRMCETAAAVAARANAVARQHKWERRGHRALMNDKRCLAAVLRWI